MIRTGSQGPSLAGFERLTRSASLLGAGLLLPSLVLGFYVASRKDAPQGLLYLTIFVGGLFALLVLAWIIWWRRPMRGRLAAVLNLTAALLLILVLAVVHPLVLGGGS